MNQKLFIIIFILFVIGLASYLWQSAKPQTRDSLSEQEQAEGNAPANALVETEKSEPAPNEKVCLSMTLTEAKTLAQASVCGEQGNILNGANCNEGTKTWWLDFSPKESKSGCNPACVINIETRLAEINWRCTGLAETKKYNMTDVGMHNSADNCWTAVDGKVYDLTDYLNDHPAGKVILQGCGTDASILFGGKHGQKAKENLGNYYIGDL